MTFLLFNVSGNLAVEHRKGWYCRGCVQDWLLCLCLATSPTLASEQSSSVKTAGRDLTGPLGSVGRLRQPSFLDLIHQWSTLSTWQPEQLIRLPYVLLPVTV